MLAAYELLTGKTQEAKPAFTQEKSVWSFSGAFIIGQRGSVFSRRRSGTKCLETEPAR